MALRGACSKCTAVRKATAPARPEAKAPTAAASPIPAAARPRHRPVEEGRGGRLPDGGRPSSSVEAARARLRWAQASQSAEREALVATAEASLDAAMPKAGRSGPASVDVGETQRTAKSAAAARVCSEVAVGA